MAQPPMKIENLPEGEDEFKRFDNLFRAVVSVPREKVKALEESLKKQSKSSATKRKRKA